MPPKHLVAGSTRVGPDLREVADRYAAKDGKPRWVAGAIGPTNKTLSLSPDVNDPGFPRSRLRPGEGRLSRADRRAGRGRSRLLLVETIFDTLNAKAAIMATLEAEQALGRELPLMISMTLTDLSGRNLSANGRGVLGLGAPRAAADDRAELLVRRGPAEAASRGAVGDRGYVGDGLPECGVPNELGEYDEAAEETAAQVREWATADWSTLSAAVAGRLLSTLPPFPGRCAIARRAPSRLSLRHLARRSRADADRRLTWRFKSKQAGAGARSSYRRALQRHRLRPLQEAGARRRLRRRGRGRARPGRKRRPDPRRQHGRGPAR